MEGVKEFLESTTIHGLVYISTAKTAFSKLFWVVVVVVGFLTAAFLIQRSFSDWEENPFSTSIETYPISKALYPRVTVCPPVGTNTALNNDLVKADIATLDQEKRDELIKLAGLLLQEEEIATIIKVENSFEEEGKYRNWYEGYSRVTLPYVEFGTQQYRPFTSKTSGSITTPWFQEKFSAERFMNKAQYIYYIRVPDNISVRAYLRMDMMMDTKETSGGTENITIVQPGDRSRAEMFSYSANVTVAKKWHIATPEYVYITGEDNRLAVDFERDIPKDSLENWRQKRMTGCRFTWHLEDQSGDRLEIEPQVSYLSDQLNVQFMRFVNIVHQAVTVHDLSVTEMKENLKTYRVKWIGVEKQRAASLCQSNTGFVNIDIIASYLSDQEDTLNLDESKGPVFKKDITDSFIKSCFEIYLYLAYCPRLTNIAWKMFYEDLFTNFSPRFIIQTIVDKKSRAQGMQNNVHGKLLEVLDKHLKFENDKLGLAFFTKSELMQNNQFEDFHDDLHSCSSDNCGQLENTIRSIGILKILSTSS